MSDEKQKLEISQSELALIESALHTQAKILTVQASAGGAKALARLNDVKGALSTIRQQKPHVKADKPRQPGVFFSMARMFG
ncbi:hypothetical protein [Sulfitobacter sp. CW3]|jgi:hypothetical protein|uniref:hypothetical protein n=1 Tax=unclassified Sulfitobacter TaxID=196795 RepID=UPI0019E7F8C9|nr:hypothetical protein [Sulfitobacter sp. CW3]MBW4963173.1 hypothetical protein [Sulfitobacter sp. CW3]NOR31616.1 hypothetical protein [Sulfitobacter sp.]|tara:strand:- start:61914 stop:62156 length:243 start_codon:yes stop_codon:yes gene_type:complete